MVYGQNRRRGAVAARAAGSVQPMSTVRLVTARLNNTLAGAAIIAPREAPLERTEGLQPVPGPAARAVPAVRQMPSIMKMAIAKLAVAGAAQVETAGRAEITDSSEAPGGSSSVWGWCGCSGDNYSQGGGAAGGAAGKAVKLNGNSITWLGGNDATRVKGAVN